MNAPARPEHTAPSTISLPIEGMSCASCVGRVEAALKKVEGVGSVSVNLATERADIVPAGQVDRQALIAAIEKAGYDVPAAAALATGPAVDAAPAIDEELAARKEAERVALRRDLALATVLALPVFVLEMGSHLIPGLHHLIAATIGLRASWLLQFALTTAVLAGPGRRFYRHGLPALLRGAPDMNSLVAVGTLAAYGYSVVATFE